MRKWRSWECSSTRRCFASGLLRGLADAQSSQTFNYRHGRHKLLVRIFQCHQFHHRDQWRHRCADPADAGTATVNCNSNVKIKLTSASVGLVNGNATQVSSGYVKKIDYVAQATYNGLTETLDTSSTGASAGSEHRASNGGGQSAGPLTSAVTPVATPPARPGGRLLQRRPHAKHDTDAVNRPR